MLEVRDITKIYNAGAETEMKLFDHFSLTVEKGQFVSIVGGNGSGKTSLLNIICGSIPIEGGDVLVGGKSIAKRRDYQRYATMGRVYQDPALGTCPSLTVLENLKIGAYLRKDKDGIQKDIEWVYSLFPRLQERSWQAAGTLSGGEQQMLAVGRALMSRPKLMMLDEPSLGLAPLVVQDIFSIIKEINNQGVTVLLIEQNANMALKTADLAYVLETGNITMRGTGAELLADEKVKEAYLGKHKAK